MRKVDIFTSLLAVVARLASILIMAYLIKKQKPALSLPENKDSGLRSFLMVLLVVLLSQNIIPIFAMLVDSLTVQEVNMAVYFINNSLFSLAGSVIMLTIYKTK